MKKYKLSHTKASAGALAEIEPKLKKLHDDVLKEMQQHIKSIRNKMSEDFKDALAIRDELEVIEQEEKIEEEAMFQILEAMGRLNDKNFGICADCGKQIPVERLKAVPYAKYCVTCQGKRERRRP